MIQSLPWNRKYRPSTVEDLIATDETRVWVESIIHSRVIPNITLYSEQPGVGKTTIAKLIASNCCGKDEILFINGSLDRGLDIIRNEMLDFITSATITNGHKCIIIDEADSMNPLALAAMRAFMEEWDQEVSFILTCNDLSKFSDTKIAPILSRCPVKDLTFFKGQKDVMTAIYKRLSHILRMENVEFDQTDLKRLIVSFYPDMRTMITQLQSSSLTGRFMYNLVQKHDTMDVNTNLLVQYLKSKDYPGLRAWAKEYFNTQDIYTTLYNSFSTIIPENKFEEMVIILGKYAFESNLTSSKEITFTACLFELGKLL